MLAPPPQDHSSRPHRAIGTGLNAQWSERNGGVEVEWVLRKHRKHNKHNEIKGKSNYKHEKHNKHNENKGVCCYQKKNNYFHCVYCAFRI